MERGAWWATVHMFVKSQERNEVTEHTHMYSNITKYPRLTFFPQTQTQSQPLSKKLWLLLDENGTYKNKDLSAKYVHCY